MAWYNKYRPQQFSEVIGQKLVKSVLQNAIAHNKLKHGYLLSGPKGTGKTTLARIFASSLNQLESNPEARMDIIELDAASNTGVDNIRQLIDSAQTPPFAGQYKVYIIDEVHMLSKSAMSALLKILEEPPVYLVFLLATTNPEKLLPTVLSRLTKLTLTSHTEVDIVDRLAFIANEEGMIVDKEALLLIAKRSNGGQRDAINLLETLFSYGLDKYTLGETTALLGLLPVETLNNLGVAILGGNSLDLKANMVIIEQLGIDGESFLGQFLEYILAESFEGNYEFDSLIIPVAEVLNLRLPINTPIASIALIQAKFHQINGQINTQFTIVSQKKNQKYNLESESELDQKLNSKATKVVLPEVLSVEIAKDYNNPQLTTNNPESELESIPAIVPKTQTTPVVTQSLVKESPVIVSNIEPDSSLDIQGLLDVITNESNCPHILKMIATDIRFESRVDNTFCLSISSPLFLPQLKVLKNQQFLVEYLQTRLGIDNIQLDIQKRQANSNPIPKIQSHSQSKPNEQQEDNLKSNLTPIQSQPTVSRSYAENSNSESPKPKQQQQTKTQLDQSKFVYYVYKALPDNTVGDTSKTLIWSKPFDLPIAKTVEIDSSQEQNRDIHLEAMFEFED